MHKHTPAASAKSTLKVMLLAPLTCAVLEQRHALERGHDGLAVDLLHGAVDVGREAEQRRGIAVRQAADDGEVVCAVGAGGEDGLAAQQGAHLQNIKV